MPDDITDFKNLRANLIEARLSLEAQVKSGRLNI